MLAGRVVELAKPPWASPVFPVLQTDGYCRFSVNYRQLNSFKIRDTCPISRMDEYIDSMGDFTVFTTLDADSEY